MIGIYSEPFSLFVLLGFSFKAVLHHLKLFYELKGEIKVTFRQCLLTRPPVSVVTESPVFALLPVERREEDRGAEERRLALRRGSSN